MKNITLSADEKDIEDARKEAAAQNTTLNNLFRGWLKQYVRRHQSVAELKNFLDQAPYFTSKRKFTREEMNQR